MKKIILQTQRCDVFVPTAESFANWYKLESDQDVMRYVTSGKPRDENESRIELQKTIDHYKKYGFSFYDIYKKDDREFIGRAGLIHLYFDEKNANIEIGYLLHKKHWGRGYATELAKAFLNFGFSELNLKKIVGCCKSANIASSHVMKKCGMKYTGKYLYGNEYESDMYAINNTA